MRGVTFLMVAASVALSSVPAAAIVISVEPASTSVVLGQSTTIDVNISGLGAFVAPSLSTFDVEVGYDTSLLSPTLVTFGSELDLFGFGSIQGSGPGFVLELEAFELSLDAPSDLDALQSGTFTLFTVTFQTLALGTTSIDLFVNALGDADGLPLDADVERGNIRIREEPTQAPEPTTLLLICAGLVVFRERRRRSGA